MASKIVTTLYRGPAGNPGSYMWSPFVCKLEFQLRIAGISYSTESGSMSAAPMGKVPYIKMQKDDHEELLGDSDLIVKHLRENGTATDLNARLKPLEKAQDHALRALLEHKLYFFQGHERWVRNFYTLREHIFGNMSWPVRYVIGSMVYRKRVASYHDQGAGRFTEEQLIAFTEEIWGNFANVLTESKKAIVDDDGEKPFWVLGGESPTDADASLYGFLGSALACIAGPDSQSIIKSHPVLLDYAGRIHRKYFPDYEK